MLFKRIYRLFFNEKMCTTPVLWVFNGVMIFLVYLMILWVFKNGELSIGSKLHSRKLKLAMDNSPFLMVFRRKDEDRPWL